MGVVQGRVKVRMRMEVKDVYERENTNDEQRNDKTEYNKIQENIEVYSKRKNYLTNY